MLAPTFTPALVEIKFKRAISLSAQTLAVSMVFQVDVFSETGRALFTLNCDFDQHGFAPFRMDRDGRWPEP